jgi:hypothetical protein
LLELTKELVLAHSKKDLTCAAERPAPATPASVFVLLYCATSTKSTNTNTAEGDAFFVASSVLTAELNADDCLALKVLAVKSRDFVAYGRLGARDERNQT